MTGSHSFAGSAHADGVTAPLPALHDHNGNFTDIAENKAALVPLNGRNREVLNVIIRDCVHDLNLVRVVTQTGAEDQRYFKLKINLRRHLRQSLCVP